MTSKVVAHMVGISTYRRCRAFLTTGHANLHTYTPPSYTTSTIYPLLQKKTMLNTIFDRCVHDLELNGGYALLPLSELQASTSSNIIISTAFEQARCALDEITSSSGTTKCQLPVIDPSTDSGSWTGFHEAATINGRYNAHRKGFVFSNGELFGLESMPEFKNNLQQLFHFCHDVVATGVLRAIERRLELPDDYFDKELGPTANSSQWHLKQYHVNESIDATEMSQSVLLPTHTDPSLISVVIIDSPEVNKGGKGLEVYEKDKWTEVSHHGHDIAIIFVGSVLSYLTKQQVFSAIKHRVVNDSHGHVNERMACTLFVRPCPDAQMKMLPSKYINQHESSKQPPTFETWNRRVSKNYMKQQKKKQ